MNGKVIYMMKVNAEKLKEAKLDLFLTTVACTILTVFLVYYRKDLMLIEWVMYTVTLLFLAHNSIFIYFKIKNMKKVLK